MSKCPIFGLFWLKSSKKTNPCYFKTNPSYFKTNSCYSRTWNLNLTVSALRFSMKALCDRIKKVSVTFKAAKGEGGGLPKYLWEAHCSG